MLHIKLMEMKRRTPCKDWVKRSKHFFFLKKAMLHIKLQRSVEHYASKMFDLMHTPDLLGWVKRSDIEIVQISIF